MFVEAHVVGADDWTTLPDAERAHRDRDRRQLHVEGVELHPFLAHYQGADCSPTGTTGAWNAATGASDGWQELDVDLSAYAGKQVEMSISYMSDWGTQGLGVFLDDVRVEVDGAVAGRPRSRPISAAGPWPARRRAPARAATTGPAASGVRRGRGGHHGTPCTSASAWKA